MVRDGWVGESGAYVLCKVDDPDWKMMRKMRAGQERRYGLKETQGEDESMEGELKGGASPGRGGSHEHFSTTHIIGTVDKSTAILNRFFPSVRAFIFEFTLRPFVPDPMVLSNLTQFPP